MLKKLSLLVCLTLLAVAFIVPAAQAQTMVQKVDNFVLLIDQSGSMAETSDTLGAKKIVVAKALAGQMNQAIPELPYIAGAALFAPVEIIQQPGVYNKAAMAQAISGINTEFSVYGRNTPMGDALAQMEAQLDRLSGRTAIVVFTDGDSNFGIDPVAEAQRLYAKYGDRICIHIVSFADTDNGREVIEQIRAMSPCTVAADAASLADGAVMDAFVRNVFYDIQAPAPAPVEDEVIVFRSLNFGFDKYQITDEMIPALEQALDILAEKPNLNVVVEGHTDSIGTEQYNQGLSERRAGSVAAWLVEHGIAASRIQSVGMGELQPKYDNNTSEGRALNRRVEIRTR